MRVLVVGAGGATGSRLIEQACAAGHDVRAFSHSPISDLRVDVENVVADALDSAALDRAVMGCDAVLCALGPTKSSPQDLCGRSTANLVRAMKRAHVPRLICVTGAMIGLPDAELGWLYRRLRSRRALNAQLADRREQERLVTESGLDWTLVRPVRLTDRRPRKAACAGEHLHVGATAKVSRDALASFMLSAAFDPKWCRRAVTLLG